MFRETAGKRYLVYLVSILLVVGVTSCATVVVKAPEGKTIQLTTDISYKGFTKTKQVWYVLWGLVPVTNNTTADLLDSAPNNAKVNIKTEISPMDWLITTLLGPFSITTRTVSVDIAQ